MKFILQMKNATICKMGEDLGFSRWAKIEAYYSINNGQLLHFRANFHSSTIIFPWINELQLSF